jgi:hypothetical protein
MNILKKTTCYLAGNLENTSDAEDWRNRFAKKLSLLGVTALDPTKKMFLDQLEETEEVRNELKKWRETGQFDKLHSFMKDIIRRDLRAVDISTFCIFKLEPSKPSYGTIHELVIASQQRKPLLFLIDDIKQMPLWLIGLVNMNYVFQNEEDLFIYLNLVNENKIALDTKYWKILLDE